jgi:hypothetical protein
VLPAGEDVAEHVLGDAGGFAEGALTGELVAHEPFEVVAILAQSSHAAADCDPAAQVLRDLVDLVLRPFRPRQAPLVVEPAKGVHPVIVEVVPVRMRSSALLNTVQKLPLFRIETVQEDRLSVQVEINVIRNYHGSPR